MAERLSFQRDFSFNFGVSLNCELLSTIFTVLSLRKCFVAAGSLIAQPSPVSEQLDDEQEEELVVQGNRAPTDRVPSGTTATRTDTALRDIPQSIQVIPGQVLDDQKVARISDAVRNISGVTALVGYGGTANNYTIQGFEALRQLRNGFTDAESGASYNVANIERVEVFKGSASVLYGQFEPGGVVNYVTKQPLREPYYAAEFSAGSYNFYRLSLDISGSLTTDKKLLYRLNVAYEDAGNFRGFVYNRTFLIAPVLTYNFSEKMSLTLEFEYQNIEQTSIVALAMRFAFKICRSVAIVENPTIAFLLKRCEEVMFSIIALTKTCHCGMRSM